MRSTGTPELLKMQKVDHIFHYSDDFKLEAGGLLHGFQLKYTTLGQLNPGKDNVIWVCHALTGNSDVTTWWDGFFNDGSPFDPRDYFIICANTLAGCYGSTGPLSINPAKGVPFYHDFPPVTHRDIVRAFDLLRQSLNIQRIHTLTGGSLGGQQALEWAIQKPDVFQHLIPMACNAVHSPWGIAFNEAQRMAIKADPTWQNNEPRAGIEGMKAARAVAMISYRAYKTFEETQAEKATDKIDDYRAASYQRYQGQKLANRFNAFTYWALSKAMDSHHVGRGEKSIHDALRKIKAKTLIIGIDNDILFPLHEQQYLADHIPGASLEVLSSLYGHDGFLADIDPVKKIIRKFYQPENAQILS
jgi:homoserine O-acetyltransferase/O-succinyltransferase